MQIMAGAGCQHPALRWALPRGTSLPSAGPEPSATPERDKVLLRMDELEDVGMPRGPWRLLALESFNPWDEVV